MDLLDLGNLRQLAVQESEHDYHIEASSNRTDHRCTYCGCAATVGFVRTSFNFLFFKQNLPHQNSTEFYFAHYGQAESLIQAIRHSGSVVCRVSIE